MLTPGDRSRLERSQPCEVFGTPCPCSRFWIRLSGSALAQGTAKDSPSPAALLELDPSLPGVEYDTPADEATKNACKVETVLNAQNKSIGYALRDPQGKMLRRFVVAHAGRRLDQWSYYQDGFEVYREDDLNGDTHLDECRWLNSGGSRIALIEREDHGMEADLGRRGVEGAGSGPRGRRRGVARDRDGDARGTGGRRCAQGRRRQDRSGRGEASASSSPPFKKQLIGWNAQTIWNRFDGTFPHVIPADPAVGLAKDVTLYENAMVIPGTTAAQQNAAKLAFLQIPDMIQLGATWKFIELPHAIDPEKPIVAAASGIRSMLFDRAASAEPRDEAMELALKALADYDMKNAQLLLQAGEKASIARYHVDRIPLLRAIVKASKNEEEKLGYNKQVVDSLISALRTGHYPEGRKPLESTIKEGGKLASYASYSLIDADFAIKNDEPGANFVANQKKWMAELEDFLDKFPDSDEAAPVLFHLANANEFNADEAKAREQYGRLVKDLLGDRRRQESGRRASAARSGGQAAGDHGHGTSERHASIPRSIEASRS